MKRALFPGTFDPPSLGHLDIIERASKICDKLYIAIALNPSKRAECLFTIEEKKEMVKEITQTISNLEVVSFSGLVTDFAKKNSVDFLVRGLRAFSDFEYEFRMALANRRVSGLETVFLMADARHAHISSSLIREFAHYKTRLHDFVPKVIEERVYQRFSA